jgi:hypothetical protein
MNGGLNSDELWRDPYDYGRRWKGVLLPKPDWLGIDVVETEFCGCVTWDTSGTRWSVHAEMV